MKMRILQVLAPVIALWVFVLVHASNFLWLWVVLVVISLITWKIRRK
ncbi:hypothetical protein [Neobacillus cucumis]|nr:hypothetical protein [Neobacillus cucumis]